MSTPNPYQTQYQPPAPRQKHWIRQHWLALLLVVLVAGAVGFGAGASDSQQASDTLASQADDNASVKTKTVTSEVTPEACLDALDAAEDIRTDAANGVRQFVKMNRINQQWPDLVLRAAQAGASYDQAEIADITSTIEGMTADTNDVTRNLNRISDDTTGHVYDYEHAAAECRGTR